MPDQPAPRKPTWPPAIAVDTFIRLILLGGLLAWCVLILAPFTTIMLWAVILSVALYPFFTAVTRWVGGRPAMASLAIVVVGLVAVGIPAYYTGQSLVGSLKGIRDYLSMDQLHVPQLPADWYTSDGLRGMIAAKWPKSDGAVAQLLREHMGTVKALVKGTVLVRLLGQ